ncbi:GntR family transcriptional regulator [Nocardioides marmoriginsengisoli]|uniref:GntR family transcriptional regulator n=1 Tax=Nocardioides marmoriginsengisoli TaxID=661483 RepID=UPI001FE82D22|nr:GntR family transcriptional regulator [Nocardioides marmoriginsengisoli]
MSTVDRVADELRRALFEGEIEPGTPLREVALATSLGVSRSTVREALGALVADGLVDRVANKGTVVHALTPEGISDICRARLVLEAAGIDAWANASEEARAAVRAAQAEFTRLTRNPVTAQELTAAHLDIHRSIAALTESPRLVATAEALYAEIRLALAHLDRVRGNTTEQAHAHGDLLELLEGGHLDEARAALVEHLAGAEESLMESVQPLG